jgi:hypothetical protein
MVKYIPPIGAAFGNWESKTLSVVYQAPTDGIVVGWFVLAPGWSVYEVGGYTDSQNPPQTMRVHVRMDAYNRAACMAFPVKKNDYWCVSLIAGSVNPYAIYFLPLGS